MSLDITLLNVGKLVIVHFSLFFHSINSSYHASIDYDSECLVVLRWTLES